MAVPAHTTALREYLTGNAADRVDCGRPRKINVSILDGEESIRGDRNPVFLEKNIGNSPSQIWEKNKKTGSLSRCETYHTQAEQGSFYEHEVRIPSDGR